MGIFHGSFWAGFCFICNATCWCPTHNQFEADCHNLIIYSAWGRLRRISTSILFQHHRKGIACFAWQKASEIAFHSITSLPSTWERVIRTSRCKISLGNYVNCFLFRFRFYRHKFGERTEREKLFKFRWEFICEWKVSSGRSDSW